MKTFVQYGAGNIGRGFIGQLFSQGGYDVKFIEVNPQVISLLNSEGSYPVTVVDGDKKEDILVERVSAVDGKDEELVARTIAGADAMATAIGVNILPLIAGTIAKGIILRYERGMTRPLDIIICENMLDADKYLSKLIREKLNSEQEKYFDKYIGLVEASIGKMVPLMTEEQRKENPLRVHVEKYNQLPVDKDAFKGEIPDIPGIFPFSPFTFYLERKLLIHNMGHAMTAYLGDFTGVDYIYQSIGNSEIKLIVLNAMMESALALSKKFKIEFNNLYEHIIDLLNRFSNYALGDTVNRVGHDVKRKISSEDRFVAAIRLCEQEGLDSVYIPAGIACSLFFRKAGDTNSAELFSDLDQHGPAYILENYCKILSSDNIHSMIIDYYTFLKRGASITDLLKHIEDKKRQLNKDKVII